MLKSLEPSEANGIGADDLLDGTTLKSAPGAVGNVLRERYIPVATFEASLTPSARREGIMKLDMQVAKVVNNRIDVIAVRTSQVNTQG